jgi:hypothetical protein
MWLLQVIWVQSAVKSRLAALSGSADHSCGSVSSSTAQRSFKFTDACIDDVIQRLSSGQLYNDIIAELRLTPDCHNALRQAVWRRRTKARAVRGAKLSSGGL